MSRHASRASRSQNFPSLLSADRTTYVIQRSTKKTATNHLRGPPSSPPATRCRCSTTKAAIEQLVNTITENPRFPAFT